MWRLGELPLIHQPGSHWMYHTGLDVSGVLIARASDRTLGEFMTERLFTRLGMRDSGFHVPFDKLTRFATVYMGGPDGKSLQVLDPAAGGKWSRPPAFESGGGGLVSTVDDFNAFGRMLLDEGQAKGDRILQAASVAEMMKDQVTQAQKAASPFFPRFWDKQGWGLGMVVVTQPRHDICSSGPLRLVRRNRHHLLHRSGPRLRYHSNVSAPDVSAEWTSCEYDLAVYFSLIRTSARIHG